MSYESTAAISVSSAMQGSLSTNQAWDDLHFERNSQKRFASQRLIFKNPMSWQTSLLEKCAAGCRGSGRRFRALVVQRAAGLSDLCKTLLKFVFGLQTVLFIQKIHGVLMALPACSQIIAWRQRFFFAEISRYFAEFGRDSAKLLPTISLSNG